MLAFGAGCAAELPSSLGNIDSSSDAGIQDQAETTQNAGGPSASGPGKPGQTTRASKSGTDRSPAYETDAHQTPMGSPDEELVVVDRLHGLPPDYEPDDLVGLHALGIYTLRGERMKLRDEAASAAANMILDARANGIELVVCSAYRSHETQVISYGRLTAIYGENAKGFIARPGHSEHQLGTAIDVSNANAGYRLRQWFGDTEASDWLRQSAAEYGFVLSYTRDSEEETGYRWEPWHYRYIGRDNALSYERGDYENPQEFFLEEGVLPSGGSTYSEAESSKSP